jgi:ribosome-associated protein
MTSKTSNKTSKKFTPKKFKQLVEKELDELQGIDTVYIDISKLTSVADGMWVTTGRSRRHTQAIAENLMEKLKENGMPALSISGYENAEWILIDCTDYLVHVLLQDMRDFYQLEDLWQISEHPQKLDKALSDKKSDDLPSSPKKKAPIKPLSARKKEAQTPPAPRKRGRPKSEK